MPDERQLRTIASGSLEDQKEVWKKHKPSKANPQVSWWSVAQALTKTRMYARDASFGEDLAQAYGILWQGDLFAPADEDSRYTTDVEAYLGAQHEWMASHLPKRGAIAEVNECGQPKLPPKADRVYGKPGKSDHTAMYLGRSALLSDISMARRDHPSDSRGNSRLGRTPTMAVASCARARPHTVGSAFDAGERHVAPRRLRRLASSS